MKGFLKVSGTDSLFFLQTDKQAIQRGASLLKNITFTIRGHFNESGKDIKRRTIRSTYRIKKA